MRMLWPMGCEVGEVIRSVVRFDHSGETGKQRGSRGRCGFVDEVFWLDVIQVGQAGGPSNGFVEQVAISGGVNLNDEGRKKDMHTEAPHPNKSASTLALMGSQTVEGDAKVRDVKTVLKQNFLAVKRYYRQSMAGDWGKGVVPHPNATS